MNKKRLTIEIEPELHAEIKLGSYREGKTIRAKLLELLREWLRSG